MMTGSTFTRHWEIAWRGGQTRSTSRLIAEETAIALTYNGSTHAVMMGTPADLEDFGIGFSLTEAIVERRNEIRSIDLIPNELGIEVRMWLDGDRAASMAARRRAISGPVGCGLCGIESLAEALRSIESVRSDCAVPASFISAALAELARHQHLNRQTHAVHAAAWCRPGHEMVVREDVGRHNALDKLAGALARKRANAQQGFLLLSSRVSIEMVQKTAAIGIPIVVAISAPTAMAVRACGEAGITLIAVARQDGFEVFTHPRRIRGEAPDVGAATY